MELFQHTRAGGGLPPKAQRSATYGGNNAVSATAGSVYIIAQFRPEDDQLSTAIALTVKQ